MLKTQYFVKTNFKVIIFLINRVSSTTYQKFVYHCVFPLRSALIKKKMQVSKHTLYVNNCDLILITRSVLWETALYRMMIIANKVNCYVLRNQWQYKHSSSTCIVYPVCQNSYVKCSKCITNVVIV